MQNKTLPSPVVSSLSQSYKNINPKGLSLKPNLSPAFIICRVLDDDHSDQCEVISPFYLFIMRDIGHLFLWLLAISRKWQPTPVFLPENILWTEEPGGHEETDRAGHDWATKQDCLLWGNVCLDFLPTFWLNCLSFISFMNYLYILEMNPLSIASFANIFLSFWGLSCLQFLLLCKSF